MRAVCRRRVDTNPINPFVCRSASQVLVQQQQSHIDEAIVGAQHDSLVKLAIEHNIRLNEFEDVLQPIVDSCTKDSISAGKPSAMRH